MRDILPSRHKACSWCVVHRWWHRPRGRATSSRWHHCSHCPSERWKRRMSSNYQMTTTVDQSETCIHAYVYRKYTRSSEGTSNIRATYVFSFENWLGCWVHEHVHMHEMSCCSAANIFWYEENPAMADVLALWVLDSRKIQIRQFSCSKKKDRNNIRTCLAALYVT